MLIETDHAQPTCVSGGFRLGNEVALVKTSSKSHTMASQDPESPIRTSRHDSIDAYSIVAEVVDLS